jgi:hypothetical protein
MIQAQPSFLRATNTSAKALVAGTISLYYDDASGTRNIVPNFTPVAVMPPVMFVDLDNAVETGCVRRYTQSDKSSKDDVSIRRPQLNRTCRSTSRKTHHNAIGHREPSELGSHPGDVAVD